MIYSHSGILYEIIPDALRPTHNVEKPKPGPHADGVVGYVKYPTIESLDKQLHELFVEHSTVKVEKATPHPRMQMFLHNPLRREISSPVGKRRKEKRVRETKTSKNPQTMLMGGKKEEEGEIPM